METRETVRRIFQAGVDAVAPDAALLRRLRVEDGVLHVDGQHFALDRGVLVVGAGKGVGPAAQAVERLLAPWLVDGLVVTKYGHSVPLERIRVREAAHPVPDAAGQAATVEMLELVRQRQGQHLVLCLFTGGASALTPAPVPGLTLRDLQAVTQAMLASGATIHELNAVRKHLSVFSGGQLARAAAPSPLLTVLVSDVVGDNLDVIASGPTVPDASSFATCRHIVDAFNLEPHLPDPVRAYLRQGEEGLAPETPKPGDAIFDRTCICLVASNRDALRAAADKAEALGCEARILDAPLLGEARETACALVRNALELRRTRPCGQRPLCLLAGGETTVTLHGAGLGGRCQEMALAASLALDGVQDAGLVALFAGTDGSDGPTEAAGGFALPDSAQRMRALGLDPAVLLADNNSHAALAAVGDLLVTGPTRTNVMDLAIVLIESPAA